MQALHGTALGGRRLVLSWAKSVRSAPAAGAAGSPLSASSSSSSSADPHTAPLSEEELRAKTAELAARISARVLGSDAPALPAVPPAGVSLSGTPISSGSGSAGAHVGSDQAAASVAHRLPSPQQGPAPHRSPQPVGLHAATPVDHRQPLHSRDGNTDETRPDANRGPRLSLVSRCGRRFERAWDARESAPSRTYRVRIDPDAARQFEAEDAEVAAAIRVGGAEVILPPQDRLTRAVIDTFCTFVAKDGPQLEGALAAREQGSPEFAWLQPQGVPPQPPSSAQPLSSGAGSGGGDIAASDAQAWRDNSYYRWRLYSLLQGESLFAWRSRPFRMQPGGRWVVPPPCRADRLVSTQRPPAIWAALEEVGAYRLPDNDNSDGQVHNEGGCVERWLRESEEDDECAEEWVERELLFGPALAPQQVSSAPGKQGASSSQRRDEPRHGGPSRHDKQSQQQRPARDHRDRRREEEEAATAQEWSERGLASEWEGMLQSLTMSRASVLDAMGWALDHGRHSRKIADTMVRGTSELPAPALIARLYLAADILANSAAPVPNASTYRAALQSALPWLFEALGAAHRRLAGARITREGLRERTGRVLTGWAQSATFPPAHMLGFEAAFHSPAAFNEAQEGGAAAAAAGAFSPSDVEELLRQAAQCGVCTTGGPGTVLQRLLWLRDYAHSRGRGRDVEEILRSVLSGGEPKDGGARAGEQGGRQQSRYDERVIRPEVESELPPAKRPRHATASEPGPAGGTAQPLAPSAAVSSGVPSSRPSSSWQVTDLDEDAPNPLRLAAAAAAAASTPLSGSAQQPPSVPASTTFPLARRQPTFGSASGGSGHGSGAARPSSRWDNDD